MNMKEHINDLFFFLLIIWVLFLTSCEKQDPLCKKGEYTHGVMCPEIYESMDFISMEPLNFNLTKKFMVGIIVV